MSMRSVQQRTLTLKKFYLQVDVTTFPSTSKENVFWRIVHSYYSDFINVYFIIQNISDISVRISQI